MLKMVGTRGRPLGVKNDPRKPQRNITFDEDLLGRMHSICDRMANDLGFRPTLSQALRHLITTFEKEHPK